MEAQQDMELQDQYEVIYQLLTALFGSTGMRLSIFQENGEVYKRTGRTEKFCAYVQDVPETETLCSRCTHIGLEEVKRTGKPFFYRCHMGLVATILPVRQGNRTIAYIVFSGYRLQQAEMDALPEPLPITNVQQEYPQLSDAFAEIPMYTRERIDETVQLLSVTAGYLAEMIQHTQLLMELRDRSLEMLTSANLREQQEHRADQIRLRELSHRVWDLFLFDALDQISLIARQEGAEQTAQLLSYLAMRTRKGTTPGARTTLGQEVAEIGDHIALLRGLYAGRIDFEMMVAPGYDPELALVQIPFGTMVDLALRNSLGQVEQGGQFAFRLRQEESYVVATFSDNGAALSPAQVRSMNLLRAPGEAENADFVTYVSVLNELKTYCGPRFHWSFSSDPRGGNELTLYMPIGEEEQP